MPYGGAVKQAYTSFNGCKTGSTGKTISSNFCQLGNKCRLVSFPAIGAENSHLPESPYTGIPTNILFFDRSGPTKAVWYYEQPLPDGKKNYTKTAPIQFEEFDDCIKWWPKRKQTDQAWKVPAADLLANGCNLDRKNPSAKEDITHLPPGQLAASILQKEHRIAEIMGNIQELLAKHGK